MVMMHVSFVNHPHQQSFVDYNHTSPADFQLRGADGRQSKPIFTSTCPDWGELRIKIGASAGPEPICFSSPPHGTYGAYVIWGPDLGLLFDDVQVPLN